jgi:seryl-tRNA synthetase
MVEKRESLGLKRRRNALKPVKTIDDLLREKNLTLEELERHRELIAECKAREGQIKEYSRASQESMKKMTDELIKLARTAEELWQEAQKLTNRVNGIYLRATPAPDKKVYH